MVHVIHLNDKILNSGGVEVYLAQLQPLLRNTSFSSSWIGIQRQDRNVHLTFAEKPGESMCTKLKHLHQLLHKQFKEERIIYHLHSISDSEIVCSLFGKAPVVRTMHEPRIFCPGQGKFWRTDEIPCPLPQGAHCVWHAYQKRCCNRHPKRLIAALKNTHFELKVAAKHYAAIVANSNWTANQAIETGFSPEQIQVIPYFTPKVEALPLPRRNLSRILFVGRLTKEKGLHYLLKALKQVCCLGVTPHLDIVGDGHERLEFENQVSQLGLQHQCTFHGWLDRQQIQERFQACNVVAFPSVYPEAFGIVGIEAMMNRRPIVAFDVGGVSEWLKNRVNGILIPPKQIDEFADALAKLCRDYQYASQLGNAGYEIALNRFLPEHHVGALTDLYHQITS